MEWQPIETAPKDGTRVLLAAPGGVYIGWWTDDAQFGQFACGTGWQIFDSEDSWYSFGIKDATHWMPVPATPHLTAAAAASDGRALK
jgi:hypothetical protein